MGSPLFEDYTTKLLTSPCKLGTVVAYTLYSCFIGGFDSWMPRDVVLSV